MYFKREEFTCKCGCGFNNIDKRVMDIAEIIRGNLGVPVHVNSGCRCQKHNKAVGGTDGSYHTKGLAADLSCSLGAKLMFARIADLKAKGQLPELKYTILYISKNFVHIDCGKERNCLFEIRP